MIIGASPANQLGNALFNHAHLMAAAWEAGTRYVNPCFGVYSEQFPRLRNDVFCADLPGLVPTGLAGVIRPRLARLAARAGKGALAREAAGHPWPGVGVVASGWASSLEDPSGVVHVDRDPFATLLRSSRVLLVVGPLFRFADRERFLRWRARIVDYFTPSPEVLHAAAVAVERARRGRRCLVAVHVRRRDYASFLDGRYHFDWDVYERAMSTIAATWGAGEVAFLVCSDEPAPVGFAADLPWMPGPGDVAGDLAALARCDRILGPPSTFSRWAAFTGDVPLYTLEQPDARPTVEGFLPVDG